MPQTEPNLRDYWWVIRRRKWIVLTVPLLLGAAAYVMTYFQAPAPLYRATAVVRYERTFNVHALLLRDIVGVSPVGDLQTNAALVKSFPVLSRAATKLGLVPRMASAVGDGQVPAAHHATIQSLAAQLEVTRTDETSLIEITATATDAASAARTANMVAGAFVENDADTRTRQIVEARRFIEAQLVDVGRRLAESEDRLRAFQEANKVLLLQEEARAAIGRLAEQQGEHHRIEGDIRALQVQIRVLAEEKGDALAGPAGGVPDGNLARLQAALSELILERDTLLLTLLPSHPQVRGVEAKIDNLRRELGGVAAASRERQLKTLASQLQMLRARSTQVAGVIGDLTAKTSALPAVALDAARIEREVKVNERIFSLLKERLQEALIKEKEQGAEITIVRPAIAPSRPVNEPEAGHRGFLGLVLGAVIGVALAFLVETLDTSIGAIHDLESLLDTPILGVIPHVDARVVAHERGGAAEAYDHFAFLPTIFASRSPIAEAIRGLRTNLLFRVLDRDVKTLVVTSTAQAEGKTTIAVNLAVTLAQLGKRTLLVEADLRNPSIRHVFGIRSDPGVTDVVLGSVSLEDAALNFADLMLGKAGMEHLLDSPGTDNLFFLPSGLRAPNPSELISSQGFTALLAEARQRYDYVVLDSAPVLSVADASILASHADGILCVVRVGHVPRAALRRAKGMLDATKTPLLGVCLNGVKAEASPDFHELTYYKRHDEPRPSEPRARPRAAALRLLPALRSRAALSALLVGTVALALGFRALNRAPAPAIAPVGSAVSVERPAAPPAPPAPAPASTPASASAPRPASASATVSSPSLAPSARPAPARRQTYSVGLRTSEGGSGAVDIGSFATEAEAIAFGHELVRSGVIPGFRVLATDGP